MTDNEKRAHDLSISLLPKVFESISLDAHEAGETNVTIDAYKECLKMYELNLRAFNRDFPNGK